MKLQVVLVVVLVLVALAVVAVLMFVASEVLALADVAIDVVRV